MAVSSAICFGIAGVFVKISYEGGLSATELLLLQYIFAVSLMLLIGIIKNREELKVNKKELFHLMILGVIGNTFMTVFYYLSFEYLPVANVTMLLYTYPVMVFIYTVIFDKNKINNKGIISIIIAFIGAILSLNIFNEKASLPIMGIIFGVLSALFYSFMNIYSEKKLASVSAFSINLYSTLFSLIFLLIYVNPIKLFSISLNYLDIKNIVLLAIICEIIPLTLLYAAIKYIGYFKVSIIGNLEIPTSIIVGYLFLKEDIKVTQLFGGFLIIVAVYLLKSNKTDSNNKPKKRAIS